MSLLLESIRIEARKAHNLPYHQKRLEQSRRSLLGIDNGLHLDSILAEKLENLPSDQSYKCRIQYGESIEKIEFLPYQSKEIKSLKMVYNNAIIYEHKLADRNQLHQLYLQKRNCDDILIIKNGLVTDSYYCNILFWTGKRWLTPAQPLLKGTQREFLYREAVISETEIKALDIPKFKSFKLVNAMIPFEKAPIIPVSQIQ